MTGHEFVESYLLPLSRQLPTGCIRESCEVLSIGRDGLWKGDLIGDRSRLNSPFRVLIRNESAAEEIVTADNVIDCSGTWNNHNWLGAGGIPCPGEREAADAIEYRLPDVEGSDRVTYAGQRVLVAGSGYSAATVVVALARLREQVPETEITWITRTDRTPPLPVIADDSLSERASLTERANALATDSALVAWKNRQIVERIDRLLDGALQAECKSVETGESQLLTVDRIIASVGFRPDRSIFQELQVHECYATEGPIRLAAALLGETSQDCLTQSLPASDTLRNPEPGFFILGAKSYGRNSHFLLRIGHEQIQAVFDLIARDADES